MVSDILSRIKIYLFTFEDNIVHLAIPRCTLCGLMLKLAKYTASREYHCNTSSQIPLTFLTFRFRGLPLSLPVAIIQSAGHR